MTYTQEEKEYILSKVKKMQWHEIPESLKLFWVNYKKNN